MIACLVTEKAPEISITGSAAAFSNVLMNAVRRTRELIAHGARAPARNAFDDGRYFISERAGEFPDFEFVIVSHAAW